MEPEGIPVLYFSERAVAGKLRTGVQLYPPATIICEVEVEIVEFVAGHLVQYLHHLFFREEMTGNIEVYSAVGKTGFVCNLSIADSGAVGNLT